MGMWGGGVCVGGGREEGGDGVGGIVVAEGSAWGWGGGVPVGVRAVWGWG